MIKRKIVFLLAIYVFLVSTFSLSFAAKEKFDTWQDVAFAMAEEFDKAIEDVNNDDYKAARDHINEAYFGYYEVQGFEKNVMVYISSKRVNHIERMFGDVKHTLLGNMEGTKETIIADIEALKVKVYRDAMILDGSVSKNADDSVGEAVYKGGEVPNWSGRNEEGTDTEVDNGSATENGVEVDPNRKKQISFFTSFGLLLREGLEAILVIVAIVTYLIKTGNKNFVKNVYYGSLLAILASVLLAVLIEIALGGSGVARELIEGWTMFLAVIVLFYVSNWMLSKSDNIKFEKYINDKVEQSISKRSRNTLIFAAFLAVLREGAELILFYKASFSSGMDDPLYIGLGMLAATVVLVIVFVIFRYTTVKLPLKGFFIFTSILLFLMCISFMGAGVVELTEANVISGRTVIPAMRGFQIPILNVYDRAETLIPQIMLVFASVYILLKHTVGKKESK